MHTARIAWCCLFSYFINELRRDGLWACPQLSSYSWWGCEYNMYHCWQYHTFNFWEKLMYVSYTTDRPGVSVRHPEGALASICLWFLWHGWFMCMGCIVKMTSLLESFYSSNVHANFWDWALQLMYVHDQLLIVVSSSGVVAMLGMGAGPSKIW